MTLNNDRLISGFIALSLLLHAGIASAQSPSALAAREMQRGNYAIAYCVWARLANADDADAQFNLGWMFHNGYGLAINDVKARQMWLLAAEKGHAQALFSLGNLYRLGGVGIDKDPISAIGYFVSAARAGSDDGGPLARVLLGELDPTFGAFRSQTVQAHAEVLGGELTVTGGSSNFRYEPDTSSRILRTLSRGDGLIELRRNGDWVMAGTRDDGLVGWIHRKLVKSG